MSSVIFFSFLLLGLGTSGFCEVSGKRASDSAIQRVFSLNPVCGHRKSYSERRSRPFPPFRPSRRGSQASFVPAFFAQFFSTPRTLDQGEATPALPFLPICPLPLMKSGGEVPSFLFCCGWDLWSTPPARCFHTSFCPHFLSVSIEGNDKLFFMMPEFVGFSWRRRAM